MRIKILVAAILVITQFTFGQNSSPYPLVTLQDINFISDTATLWPNSPLAGDTVRVQGEIIVPPYKNSISDRTPVFYTSVALQGYIQEGNSSPWSGLNIYQADSSFKGTLFDLCDTAKTYEFTGVVSPYGMGTELILIKNPVLLISSQNKIPDPITITLDSCFNDDGSFNIKLRKYLSMYVEIVPDTIHPDIITYDLVLNPNISFDSFTINNGNGHKVQVIIKSRYIRNNTWYYTLPPNGSHISYIKGLLIVYNNTWEIIPVFPGDIDPLKPFPTITNCKRNPGVVPQNTPVVVTCNVVGNLGADVQKVQLFKTVNGVIDSLDMTKGTGPDSATYTCTIPGIVSDSAYVSYYIKATDNSSLISTSPENISHSRYSFFVLNPGKPLAIQHVRYSPFGDAFSGYHGYPVTVTGVVTADTSKIPGSNANNPPRVYIQNGTTPWSAITLGYHGPFGMNVFNLKQGDLITVTGTPVSSSTAYATRLDTLTALTVVSHNNYLPATHIMKTSDVGYSALGTLTAEPWNGCIVTYKAFTIDSANADGPTNHYGESYGMDSSGGNHTRITWSDGRTQFFNGPADGLVMKGDSFASVTGILEYTHTNYKLCPRDSNDIVGYKYIIGIIKNDNYSIPTAYKLNQNFPNPFNPSTIISYDIPKSGIVSLRIFNILGQLVRTLVNQPQTAGTHQVTFNANSLNSGIYFYKLEAGQFSQVKKMILIK